ncbi:class I SAM-dependent methyltransferase [uncultured Celeribacter sp.]|uniref:class I SAM-dependent methyltransferase n=1 Tax=uncultured Celeribacter sp. TaxID=1303376 RepID=UPI002AA8EEA8|nr:class I SAM-dependent methyltransferase [uncultured Celeribacter sp.]
MLGDIPRALWYEATASDSLPRRPEHELVMNDSNTVTDYTSCGTEGGALFGPYLYNAVQVSARVQAGDLVLDLGCGSGQLLNLIAQWNPATQFRGVDLAPNMLSKARATAASSSLSNVDFIQSDFSTLESIADGSVDAVISSMALHHLPDRIALSRCFASIGRVLRPDGALYLMDFGRLRSDRSLEIFVGKVAISETEALAEDYRASLHAAFTPEDFQTEIARLGRQSVEFYRTPLAPLAMVAATPPRSTVPGRNAQFRQAVRRLNRTRRAELAQLRMFLSIGGLGFPR